MFQILLTERHPEAGTLDSGIINDERLYFLVVKQITVTRTNAGICQVLMNLQRFRLHPLSVLPVKTFLGYLADVDFRIEVGCESLVMVAGIAVNDVEILNFVEMMFGGIGRKDTRHSRIETTAEDGRQSSFAETVAIGPLP